MDGVEQGFFEQRGSRDPGRLAFGGPAGGDSGRAQTVTRSERRGLCLACGRGFHAASLRAACHRFMSGALALAELEAFAGALAAVLLRFFFARVAREQAVLAQRLA